MRLSNSDFDALQGSILDLYAYRDLPAFKAAVPRIFLGIVPAEHFLLVDARLDGATRRATAVSLWKSTRRFGRDLFARMEQTGFEHPFTRYSVETHDLRAVAGSDVAAIHMIRGARDPGFTVRDRLVMNLLRPHFDLARHKAEQVTARLNARAEPLATYRLTRRELQVALRLVRGKTNLAISLILDMQVRTVEKHVENILVKLGVENRTAAAVVIAEAENKRP
jgi:DNA-binding NarL/FixJ family response regulator